MAEYERAEEQTAVVAAGGSSLVVASDIADIVRENLGGQLSISDLDRIKIPAGGGQSWMIRTLDGEQEVKKVDGVIVYFGYQNAYWDKTIDETGGGDPPVCFARDGAYGVGNPGGTCLTCPYNQFGSDDRGGKGKACKNMAVLFVLQPNTVLPVVFMLPPTSVKVVRKYMANLAVAGLRYFQVQSSFTLEKAKNEKGTAYSVVSITSIDAKEGNTISERKRLAAADLSAIEEYRRAIIPALDRAVVIDRIEE